MILYVLFFNCFLFNLVDVNVWLNKWIIEVFNVFWYLIFNLFNILVSWCFWWFVGFVRGIKVFLFVIKFLMMIVLFIV